MHYIPSRLAGRDMSITLVGPASSDEYLYAWSDVLKFKDMDESVLFSVHEGTKNVHRIDRNIRAQRL
jgi:hypothetical protein